MLKLYENIKNRRLELGLTQTQLADKLGYADKSMIAKIEKGSIDLPQSKILAFANALKLAPGDLMGWDDNPSSSAPDQAAVLDPAEEHLLSVYRDLNNDGRNKLLGYADDLQASGRYKKYNSVSDSVV